ncbi:hypothetical protein F4782DRAFT_520391 [Xylaria castorea]|nr:hypothetical protein F4782DRAFT_520391 [Xylaria castorea]
MASSKRVTKQTPSSLRSPPSTQAHIVVHGQHQLRGPIPLVATNPSQRLPARINREREWDHHYSHYPDHHSPRTVEMDSNSQTRQSTLPLQVEEEIRAAVLASMPPTDRRKPVKRRKSVVWRKAIRWLSLSLSIALIIGVTALSVILELQILVDAILAFVWGPLLALWNGWRLFRLRQKFDREVISGWHIALDTIFLIITIALTIRAIVWTVNEAYESDYWYDSEYHIVWRGVAVSTVFVIWDILHSILLIITSVEKWTKPRYSSMDSPQEIPPIIIQYMPTYTASHEPEPGEDKNSYLAGIGDSQPQGIAPAYSTSKNGGT